MAASGNDDSRCNGSSPGVLYHSMAEEDTDIESFWEGIRPPREPESPHVWGEVDPETGQLVESPPMNQEQVDRVQELRQRLQERVQAQTNEAIQQGALSATFSLDYAQIERELLSGLGLQRDQTSEENAIMRDLQNHMVSPSGRLGEEHQRVLERFVESLGIHVRRPTAPSDFNVLGQRFEALRRAFYELGVFCSVSQVIGSGGLRHLEVTIEPTRDQDPSTINSLRNERNGLDIIINFPNEVPVRL
jgi:hypothetical protein